jgi:hypothetical protein
MERSANKKIENYVSGYKSEVKTKISELAFDDRAKINDLLEYVFEYPRLTLDPSDFVRRKRAQNSVSDPERCVAKTGLGAQCKCRRLLGQEFCGTHTKGTPNGVVVLTSKHIDQNILVEVSAYNIFGIIYYIDSHMNVFKPEDVLLQKVNPAIIAQAVRLDDGSISIPEFYV